jgi:hypothetical protein
MRSGMKNPHPKVSGRERRVESTLGSVLIKE